MIVTESAAVPVAAPPVVRTIVVLIDVATDEVVTVKAETLAERELTFLKKYPEGMVRVMASPIDTVVIGVNRRTGLTDAPARLEGKEIE